MVSLVTPEALAPQLYGLAVDNARCSRLLMSWTLSRAGCTPISACDGYSGWLLAESLLPRLVITDLDMSRWGGLRLIHAMRTSDNPVVRETPIIACSATNNPEAIFAALEAGANRFLSKPINTVQLRELIFQVLI